MFTSYSAQQSGGALHLTGDFLTNGLTIEDSSFVLNHAAKEGGAIYCSSTRRIEITLTSVYLAHNSAGSEYSL